MANIKVSDLLFKGTSISLGKFPTVKIKQMGTNGYGLCEKARAMTTVRGNTSKINASALAVDRILESKMNMACMPTMVYTEFKGVSGTLYKATCDGKSIHFLIDIPTLEIDICIPLFAYALNNITKMELTKEEFCTLKAEYTKNPASEETKEALFRTCDAFYYEHKALSENGDLPKTVDYDHFLNIDLIKQAARTGQVTKAEILTGLDLPKIEILDIANKQEKKKNAKAQENIFQSCRIGDYLIDYVWDLDRKSYIPDLSSLEDFSPDPCYFSMVNLISHELGEVKKRMDTGVLDYKAIGENYLNVQFIGRPGTGKTTIANALAATFGLPIRVIVNSKNTEEDTFQGMTKVQDGDFSFVETPFLDAYKNGGIILLEEYNLTDPGVAMGVLGQALEKPFILLEDGYREVHRHPLCVVIATANTGTQGSREPSEALTSRMPHTFLLDDPDEEQFIDILTKKNTKVSREDCLRVYQAYSKVLSYLNSSEVNAEDIALSITLRHCIAALKQMEIGIDYKDALCNTLVGTIGIKDLTIAKETKKNVIELLAG